MPGRAEFKDAEAVPQAPLVRIVMGSSSDKEVMGRAAEVLARFDIPFDCQVLSAHRTPHRIPDFTDDAAKRGVCVIIAGAGGAAALPGVIAAHTFIPVLGVAVGADAVSSILLMPGGVPVATFGGKGGAENAALFAARMLTRVRPKLLQCVVADAQRLIEDVEKRQQPELDAYLARLLR